MSNCTLTKLDADPDKREWSPGHFCVKKDDNSVALFLFDYPEARYKLNCTEAEALAAAKSFMAIDDLAYALISLTSIIESAGLANLTNGVQLGQISWCVKASECMDFAKAALEKAGAK